MLCMLSAQHDSLSLHDNQQTTRFTLSGYMTFSLFRRTPSLISLSVVP